MTACKTGLLSCSSLFVGLGGGYPLFDWRAIRSVKCIVTENPAGALAPLSFVYTQVCHLILRFDDAIAEEGEGAGSFGLCRLL